MSIREADPMVPENFKRKLAAILSADVQVYSRLMGEDEEGTIRTLRIYLEDYLKILEGQHYCSLASIEDCGMDSD